MKRKLLLLNFALIALIAIAGWRLRREKLAFQAREHAVLDKKIPILPPPPMTPNAPSPAVTASSYLDIAQKMLFSKDRNSQVIVEPPKVEPPKPMPALPVVHGVMNLGDGPMVMMSDRAGTKHRGVQPGDKVGDFKLVSVDGDELVLAWEDKLVKRKLQDLIDRSGDKPAGAAPSQESSRPVAAAPLPAGKPEPGVAIGDGRSACQPGDTAPAGTVVNGMRKVITQSPFGSPCWWEPVK